MEMRDPDNHAKNETAKPVKLQDLDQWFLRYHGRWIDSVWKSRSYADALKENPSTYTFAESLILVVIEYNHIFEIF